MALPIPIGLLSALAAFTGPFVSRPHLSAAAPVPQDPPSARGGGERPVGIPDPPGDTLVVTPNKLGAASLDVPYTVQVVDEKRIEERVYRTVPQALRDVPGLLIQETSHGQGSPFLRGFTSRRNLFLIDGIRLNNSVFREGPNQYWNTVDPLSLGKIEVFKGPGSVLYGSDAVGGTVNALPREPYIWDRAIGGKLSWRVASGESSHVARAEFGGALGPNTAWLLGVSRKDFGDVEAGGDTGLQPGTGYDEWAGDFVLEHWVSDDVRLKFAHYDVNQNEVPRTHRTQDAVSFEGTSIGNDLVREFDQDRSLTYVKMDTFGDVTTSSSVSFQRQQETRFRTRSSGAREQQGFDVGTLGVVSTAATDTDLGRLTGGLEYYRDDVDSFLDRGPSQTAADDIQGPVADDASYESLGVFLQDEIELAERTDLILGGRWTYNAADADSVRDPETDLPFSLSDSWNQITGSLRLQHHLNAAETRSVYGGISQGFRAPNLSDLTRFDTAGTDEFEIPAPDLDEERFVQFELGTKGREGRMTFEAAVYYTLFDDLIGRFPTGNVNADGDREVTKANVGDGEVYGLELGAAYDLDEDWSVFGDLAWIDGETQTFDQEGGNLLDDRPSRLQPLTLHAGLRWEPAGSPVWGEAFVTWADDADELSLRDEGDTSRIPPGGTPGYAVLDLRGGWQVAEGWQALFGIENLFDEDYRVHGSGSNRVGRNLYVGLTWSF